jgi:flavin reductase (DIM6/NTAB) family NADH-FMN oxidoreductase RutF
MKLMTEIDASEISWQDQYKLMVGTVTPRPIALVTTIGPDGPNAAPFSFFNAVGSDPAMLMFSVGDRSGQAKDTVRNIRETPEFVVHIVSDAIKEKMNICSVDYPFGVNELEKAGFTALPSRKVKPPYIAEAPVALECRLMQIVELGRKPYHVVFGEVVYFHYHDGIVNERYHVDVGAINPIGRLAGKGGYCRVTDRFEMPRIALQGKPSSE